MRDEAGRRIVAFVRDVREVLAGALRSNKPAERAEATPLDPELIERLGVRLGELQRLGVTRLNQAEQIFEFEALAAAAAVSLEALRFVDVLLGILLAAQLVVGTSLVERGDPAGAATAFLAILGVAVAIVCWGLAVSLWAEGGPVSRAFLADLNADPAEARAKAMVLAAGVFARNEARRGLKIMLFAVAVAVTVIDCAWANATHNAQGGVPPSAGASPSPTPTSSPTPAPTPRPTPQPTVRPTARPAPRRQGRPTPRARNAPPQKR